MGIFIFTEKQESYKKLFPKSAKFSSLTALSGYKPEGGDISYIDVSGITKDDIKKFLSRIKNVCKGAPWGIIDPGGKITDSAALFFEGACDYLGPGLLKTAGSFDAKRIKAAMQWRGKNINAGEDAASSVKPQEDSGFYDACVKLPSAGIFPGWKKMEAGKVMPFYLLYCSFEGKVSIDSRLDEKSVTQIHKRFLAYLDNTFSEGEGLLWMNSGKDCLFLIPPKVKCVQAVIRSCINMIVSAPMVVLESLALKFPANFIFALHYGSINYKPPGKTGTVVSEAVNFVFHMGTKKAEQGRLTISGSLPDKTIPQPLHDCFSCAGQFEGQNIWHTKKFSYSKSWC